MRGTNNKGKALGAYPPEDFFSSPDDSGGGDNVGTTDPSGMSGMDDVDGDDDFLPPADGQFAYEQMYDPEDPSEYYRTPTGAQTFGKPRLSKSSSYDVGGCNMNNNLEHVDGKKMSYMRGSAKTSAVRPPPPGIATSINSHDGNGTVYESYYIGDENNDWDLENGQGREAANSPPPNRYWQWAETARESQLSFGKMDQHQQGKGVVAQVDERQQFGPEQYAIFGCAVFLMVLIPLILFYLFWVYYLERSVQFF